MNKRVVKEALILFIITVIVAFALAGVYAVMKAPIAKADYEKTQKSYKEVFSNADSFVQLKGFKESDAASVIKKAGYQDDKISNCMQALDKSGKLLGYVITVTDPNGYGGDITFSVGVRKDGTVNGYSITTINETAGLGMKAKEPKFQDQFHEKKVAKFNVTKSGAKAKEDVDAITGATITSRAVTSGVNASIAYSNALVKQYKGEVVK